MFKYDILTNNNSEYISADDVNNALLERGITLNEQELSQLFDSLKFEHNTTDQVSQLEVYANAHLFRLQPQLQSDILSRIAMGCGVGVQQSDL